MCPQTASEQTVTIGNVHLVTTAATCSADGPRHHVSPGVDVILGVADHRRFAGSAAGGMQTHDLIHWNGKHAIGVVVAQVTLHREREARQIIKAAQVIRMDTQLIKFLSVDRHVVVCVGEAPAKAVKLMLAQFINTGGLGAHYGAEKLGYTVIPMSGGQTEKQVQLIRDFQPDIIMVTPSYMLNLADEMDRQGVDPHKLALRLGIFGAEPWTGELRSVIEQRLGITALDIYGLSEVMGPGVAMECYESKDGPTIWEDHFYPEIINPLTGEVLPDGEMGELVFTSLSKEALPMVRYRTRDLTRLLPGTARPMRRIDKITGRSDDMLIIRGVNVFPTQIEEQVLKVKQLAECYEIHVFRQGNMDSIEVHVELRAEAGELDESARNNVSRELSHHIKSHIGISSRIVLNPSYTLKRSEGKACHVYDKRKAS